MLQFSTGAAMTTAITDLLTAFMILPILLVVHKIPCLDQALKRLWFTFFLSIGAGSFLGFLAHVFTWSARSYSMLWIFLYAVLFQILYIFLRLSIHAAFGADRPFRREKKWIGVFVALAYLLTAVLVIVGINPIRFFVIYCIVMALPGLYLFIKMAVQQKDRAARIFLFSFLPQLPGVVFQLLRRGEFTLIWIFDYNSIYHLCLMASVVFFYFSARRMLWENIRYPA